MTACPGSCNAAWRRAQSQPDPSEIQPWPGDPIWCQRCTSVIRLQLSELDEAAAILRAGAAGLRGESDDEHVAGSKDPASPSPSLDDAEDLYRMLAGWESEYRRLRDWPESSRTGWLADRVTGCACWLMDHLDGILSSPIAEAFGAEVMQWHSAITEKAKAGTRRLRKPLRCPSCQLLLLAWTEGDKYVGCDGCGLLMTLAEYEAEVGHRAGETRDRAA